MATREAEVRHAEGLHARPAELVARLALRFESQVELANGSLRVDAKSILNVLTLGATCGSVLTIVAEGPDAEAAADAMAALIQSEFDEEAARLAGADSSGAG